jgi:copper(I)-binding protein
MEEPVEMRLSTFKVYPREATAQDLQSFQCLNALAKPLFDRVLRLKNDQPQRADSGLQTTTCTGKQVVIGLKPGLKAGASVVMWQVLSTDSHRTSDTTCSSSHVNKVIAMKQILTLLGALLLSAAMAQTVNLRLIEGWVRLPPPVLKSTVAYMVLENPGARPLRLTGGSAEVAGTVMPMSDYVETRNGVEVKGMREVRFLEIPAGGRLELKPGGKHLMLIGLQRPLREGERIMFNLRFEGGGTARVVLSVQNK